MVELQVATFRGIKEYCTVPRSVPSIKKNPCTNSFSFSLGILRINPNSRKGNLYSVIGDHLYLPGPLRGVHLAHEMQLRTVR